jgi:hypothetical protein
MTSALTQSPAGATAPVTPRRISYDQVFDAAALPALALSSGAIAGAPKEPVDGIGNSVAAAPAPVAKETKYCVVTKTTGSRIAKKDCRTRKEWLDTGFDPLAPDE